MQDHGFGLDPRGTSHSASFPRPVWPGLRPGLEELAFLSEHTVCPVTHRPLCETPSSHLVQLGIGPGSGPSISEMWHGLAQKRPYEAPGRLSQTQLRDNVAKKARVINPGHAWPFQSEDSPSPERLQEGLPMDSNTCTVSPTLLFSVATSDVRATGIMPTMLYAPSFGCTQGQDIREVVSGSTPLKVEVCTEFSCIGSVEAEGLDLAKVVLCMKSHSKAAGHHSPGVGFVVDERSDESCRLAADFHVDQHDGLDLTGHASTQAQGELGGMLDFRSVAPDGAEDLDSVRSPSAMESELWQKRGKEPSPYQCQLLQRNEDQHDRVV